MFIFYIAWRDWPEIPFTGNRVNDEVAEYETKEVHPDLNTFRIYLTRNER